MDPTKHHELMDDLRKQWFEMYALLEQTGRVDGAAITWKVVQALASLAADDRSDEGALTALRTEIARMRSEIEGGGVKRHETQI